MGGWLLMVSALSNKKIQKLTQTYGRNTSKSTKNTACGVSRDSKKGILW
jgi:hypothetical protein